MTGRPGLDGYEPVEARLRRFWSDHPSGRVLTELVEVTRTDTGRIDQVIVRAEVWRDQTDPAPAAVDYAEEIVGASTVNRWSALENACTSAVGRALANLGYSPKGARPSREEMEKVARHSAPADPATEPDRWATAPPLDLSTPEGQAALARKADSMLARISQDAPPASTRQVDLIGSLFRKAGTGDPIAHAIRVIGREISRLDDLTTREASWLIDDLKRTTAKETP